MQLKFLDVMENEDDTEVGSGDDEKGYLWMCGLCKGKPTFVTIYDLFAHKKKHKLETEEILNTVESDSKSYTYNETVSVIKSSYQKESQLLKTNEDDEDDVPLSRLKFTVNEKEGDSNVLEDSSSIVNNLNNDDCRDEGENFMKNDDSYDDSNLNDACISNNEDDDEDVDEDKKETIEESKSKKKPVHLCKICKEEFTTRRSLSKHKSVHICSETGMYRCQTCGKLCPKYDNFTRHLSIHEENRAKSFKCDLCLSSFYNMADLKRHAILHMEVKPFTCEHCREGFTRQDALLIHMGKHTGVQYVKFTCKLCGKVLNSPSALAMHSKNHTAKSVFCPEPDCTFSCYLKSQLRQHLRRHSGEKPFQCSICGRCFGRSNDMKNHILNVHERVRPFRCPHCPREFTLPSSLKSHTLIHSDMRPYLCAECGKRFNHPSTLRKHTQFLHRHLCDPCTEGKDVTVQPPRRKPPEKQDVVDNGVESQLPAMSIPIHFPPITVAIDQTCVPAYIVPTIAIYSTPNIIKPDVT